MTNLSTADVRSRTMTAFFDTKGAAQKATDDLVAAGIPRQQITITEGGTSATVTEASTATQDKSFWEELKELFIPDEDRYAYAEGLRRGGYLLAVKVDEANYNRVMDILDTDGAIDMDEREESWRSSGWTGYQAGTTGADVRAVDNRNLESDKGTVGMQVSSARKAPVRTAGTAATTETVQAGRDEVIPLYEETAQVAKRDVNHGRVRLRSYVTETPFSQEVNLRDESVEVTRRPVNRAVGAGDAVFQDRVIEAEEHTEEAFVTKEARVTEEVSLRKTVEDRAQTVSDTVRRTEVEIDDQRGGKVSGAMASGGHADAQRIVEHMDVIASDGTKIGTVDHLDGPDRIKLAKNTSPDGEHHYVPLHWVDHIDAHVHLNKSLAEIKAQQLK